jgi:broad-specificity NMP kinase
VENYPNPAPYRWQFHTSSQLREQPTPVLWLCGPPGVGKTTAAWEIYSRLTRDGVEVAYVDIDQLGICHPEPSSDPGRHLLKAENLGAVVTGFRAAGARCVVVSGVVDAACGVPMDRLPRATVTVCRLRTGPDELRRRLLGRGDAAELVEDGLREAGALDASDVADVCVDVSGLSVAEVARRVRSRTGGWPGPHRPSAAVEPSGPTAAGGPILWLCGATGVGKSAVGFAIYLRAVRAGLGAAYADLDQLGFCGPGDHRVKARNLAALWQNHRAAGARCLTVVGPVEDEAALQAYTDALPAATFTVCRLHAGRGPLTQRIMLRGRGGGWAQPGDPLKGRPTAHLLRVAGRAAADADTLERAAVGDLRVETDGRTVEEIADAIVARTGWPGPA